MSNKRRPSGRLPQVQYGDTRIAVDPNDASTLIACLAVAANPSDPDTTLHDARERMRDFALEREALFVGTAAVANRDLIGRRKEPCR